MTGLVNIESNAVVGYEEHQHYVVLYPPLSRGVIKEEPKSDEDQDEGRQYLIAYPPLPQVDIKEEVEIGEGHDEIIADGEQVGSLSQTFSRLFQPCQVGLLIYCSS